jgi:quinol monooxygenase YgiN
MIHVIATITAKPGKRAALLGEFHRIVPLVRAEKGCIEYGPTVDIASGISVQGSLRADVAVIVEKWESLDALKAHTQAPHMEEPLNFTLARVGPAGFSKSFLRLK